jgi:SpoVK/Ycf46/Vps4 family AAA+-type ATPase
MARSDLLKKLFRSYKGRNDPAFLDAAREIIDDERKKQHISLANELQRILDNGIGTSPATPDRALGFEPLPKDADRGAPLLEIRHPDRYLQDLVLADAQRAIVLRVIEEFRQWEVLEAHSLRPSHKLLFCGPPGCGKTVTAEVLSRELGVPLLVVRFDAVVSSLLGETAANLRKVFDYAARGVWVMLFDEFDAIGRSRDDATEHGELKRVINAFLQMLDRFSGRSLVVAATNFEQALDPALWRRFDEIVRFERPDRAQIEQLLAKNLARVHLAAGLLRGAVERLDGMSHAEVERVCLDVLRQAALRGGRAVGPEELELAVQRQEYRQQALQRSRASGAPSVDEV